MKNLIICDEGFEDIVEKALLKKFKESNKIINTETEKTIIKFDIPKEDFLFLAEIAYSFQGAIKVLANIEEFEANEELNEDKYIETLKKFEINTSQLTNIKYESITINSIRKGNHIFKSTKLTELVSKNVFNDIKRDYKQGDLSIFVYVKDEKGYIGIDVGGRSLNKRDYKIFLASNSLRATIAYDLLELAEITKKDKILDPFMGSGTIPIEAGLALNEKSPFYFTKEKFNFKKIIKEFDESKFFEEIDSKTSKDKLEVYGFDSLLKFLKHSQKNAKIADINKSINLSKVEVDWIDTKFEEKSIDKIITHPPALTEHGSKAKILKIYKEFLRRSKDILKKEAIIVVINTPKSIEELERIAKDEEFKVIEIRKIFEGKQELDVIKLKND